LNVQSEHLGDLHELLTITISPEDYNEKFKASIKDLSKKVQIKGFRPGHVPAGMVKKMYGDQALADEINKMVNQAMDEHFKESGNEILGEPLSADDEMQEINHKDQKEYTFKFEIGIQPKFELGVSEKDTFTWYKIPAKDEDIDQEIERLQKKYGNREEVEQAEELDVVYVHLQELNEDGTSKEGGIHVHTFFNHEMLTEEGVAYFKDVKSDFSSNIPDLFALFKGEKEQVAKNVLQLQEVNEELLSNINSGFECKVERILRLVPAEMNEAFFTAVAAEYGEINDEETLKAAIRSAIEHYNDDMTRVRLENEVFKQLVANTEMVLPEAFLEKWYDRNHVQPAKDAAENTGENTEETKSPEPFPVFMKQLKESLLFSKVQKESDLKATQEEIINEAVNHTRATYGQLGEEFVKYIVENNIKDRKFVESMHDRVLQGKFLSIIREKVTTKDEAITLEEYQNLQKEETNVE